jgi:hypothetical protein
MNYESDGSSDQDSNEYKDKVPNTIFSTMKPKKSVAIPKKQKAGFSQKEEPKKDPAVKRAKTAGSLIKRELTECDEEMDSDYSSQS